LVEQANGNSAVDPAQEEDPDTSDSFLREVARTPPYDPSLVTTARPLAQSSGALVAGRYRLEYALGEGGMGVVWQAVHAVTRRPVALKFLKRARDDRDPSAVRRFLREARAACAVQHPSVVEILDVLELEDGSPVIVMELLKGETLAQRLTREQSLSLSEAARILVPVCSAVRCAHALGIVHRDLKPENIFLVQPTAKSAVKVLDFGIAKLTAAEGDAAQTAATTGTHTILGTPHYMAPEQIFGEKDIDHRADVWALGVILYEMLCGVRPIGPGNLGQICKVLMTDAIVPIHERAPHLPPGILRLVTRMMSRDKASRPADVRDVLAVLSPFADPDFTPVDAAAAGRAPSRRAAHRWPFIVGASSALVLAALASMVRPWSAPSQPSPVPSTPPPAASATPTADVPSPMGEALPLAATTPAAEARRPPESETRAASGAPSIQPWPAVTKVPPPLSAKAKAAALVPSSAPVAPSANPTAAALGTKGEPCDRSRDCARGLCVAFECQ
jgi:serine/threonine protein kinase